jgi:hypothetical protein
MTMWAGKPVADPPPPAPELGPMSPPDWKAFEEAEPAPQPLSNHAHIAMTMWAGRHVADPLPPEPEPAPRPLSNHAHIAMTMWAGKPVADPLPPELEPEPLSPPDWKAFEEVEPAVDSSVWEAFTEVDMVPVLDRRSPVPTRLPDHQDGDPRWADDDLVVRPYIRTRGRVTQGYDLRLETLVSVTGPYERDPANPALTQDVLAIRDLCRGTPHSVAEVASRLNVPVGIARVLIADAIDAGLVTVDHGTALVDAKPTRELLERIRDGLRSLV